MEKESIVLSGMGDLEPARKNSAAEQGTVALFNESQARSQVV